MRAILRKMPAYSLQLRYHYAALGENFEAANPACGKMSGFEYLSRQSQLLSAEASSTLER